MSIAPASSSFFLSIRKENSQLIFLGICLLKDLMQYANLLADNMEDIRLNMQHPEFP